MKVRMSLSKKDMILAKGLSTNMIVKASTAFYSVLIVPLLFGALGSSDYDFFLIVFDVLAMITVSMYKFIIRNEWNKFVNMLITLFLGVFIFGLKFLFMELLPNTLLIKSILGLTLYCIFTVIAVKYILKYNVNLIKAFKA